MALNEIDIFLAAIRRLESGNFAGNYSARGAVVPTGQYAGERAMGAYQIMPGNWASWAREAGIPGADWRSKAAQDAVARFKFTQYYNRYGDWRLAAIAWFAGPSRAERAKAEGMAALGSIRDVNGTTVPSYVAKIVDYMHQAQDLGYGPARDDAVVARLDPEARESIRSGRLSVASTLFGAGDFGGAGGGGDPGGGGIYEASIGSSDPSLDPLAALAASQRPPRGNQLDAELASKTMHQNMSAILQGLSNSIKAGAAAWGVSSPISEREQALLETSDELAT